MALAAWISAADMAGLQVLLEIMKIVGGVMVVLLLLLLPALIPALGELHPCRSARNADAIGHWLASLPGRVAYKVS